MDEERKRDHAVPANIDEAVIEFSKARHERISTRRDRISEKIRAMELEEGEEVASISSSTEPLKGKEKDAEKSEIGSFLKRGKVQEQKDAEDEETKKSQRATEQLDIQIQESRRILEQMILDGEVLITNVKTAAEYREKDRQGKKTENKQERLARLRQEADESQEMYETLSKNWAMKAEKALPMDLYKQLKAQQEACDELLAKKDDMITYLRRETEENDFEYEKNLEIYQKDGMLMGDRIDDLIDELRIAFIEELNLIEDYTCKDRESILEENQNAWMELLKNFENMEQKNLEDRKNDAIAKFQILNDVLITTKQEARAMRHKMEDDFRILFQEREQLKYVCHMNLEKMAYNLHILQCRSQENIQLKNMMKRLLLKLHDKMDVRAAKLKRKMEMGTKHVEKISKEIERLESQVGNFGQKTFHLASLDHKRFIELWESNEELVYDKVKSLVDSDKFIYETQLGIEYAMPDLTTFELRPPEVNKSIKKKRSIALGKQNQGSSNSLRKSSSKKSGTDLDDDDDTSTSYSEASVVKPETQEDIECVGAASLLIMPSPSFEFIPGPEPDPAIQRRLMRTLAKVICNQSGFIVEEELQKILSPLLETEQNLVNLDAVLQVLGITNVEEMQGLSRYMLKYCKIMKGVMSKMDSKSAGLQEMNVSGTNVVGRAAMLEGSDLSELSLNNLESLDDTDSLVCGVEPSDYCECTIAKAKAKEKKLKKKPVQTKVKRAKSRSGRNPDKNKATDSTQFLHESQQIACDVVCCTPTSSNEGSLEDAIDSLDSDAELARMLEEQSETSWDEKNKMVKQEDSEDGLDCSFKTSKSTVLSWLESVDREKMIENLNRFNENIDKQCHDKELEETKLAEESAAELAAKVAAELEEQNENEEDEDEEEGEEEEDEGTEEEEEMEEEEEEYLEEKNNEGRTQDEEVKEKEVKDDEICTKGPRPRRLTGEERREMEKEKAERERAEDMQSIAPSIDPRSDQDEEDAAVLSDNESKTISIASFDSYSDASDEFLYIDPQDVVIALKNFIEDYDNRNRVVLPTVEEIIAKKLKKIKYPKYIDVTEYWEGTVQLLNPKGKEVWDTVQLCFDQYNMALKERNEHAVEVERYYKQNFELSHLLKKYFQSASQCYSRNDKVMETPPDPRRINHC